MSDDLTLNVIAYIRKAAASPELRKKARRYLAALITDGDLLDSLGDRSAAVFSSDFGSCSLALWAQKHGLEDIAREPIDDQLTRLDAGSMFGAWEAALFKAGAETDGWQIELEYQPDDGGHIDALALRAPTNDGDPTVEDLRSAAIVHPVEFKSSYDASAIKPPEKENFSHLLQVADYALRVGARRATLVYLKVAAPKGGRMKQFERDAEPYRGLIIEERARLGRALADEPPLADPQAKWSCFTCRYSKCPKNKNKQLDELFEVA
jgi:hypothetical protein